ncbi:helix-turn-helix domain-containing protein [Pseudonocardia sp. GCM10023141]|uniref:helix-turn-helix domain-containing protein n=1 Tax=Pseudonocardia sp. GCM10023141 TaxID=3252653 RepID=UPI00360C4BF7
MSAKRHANLADSCLRILEAGAGGTDRVFAVLTRTARALTGAGGAAVVGWQPAGALALAVSGPELDLPDRRFAEGVTRSGLLSIASLVVQGEVDLVVWWDGDGPSADQLEELRVLAALAATASRRAADTLSALYAVARRLLAAGDREEMLLGLATATADVLRAEIAAVFLATPDGEHVETKAVVGHRSVGTARLRLARGESMVGHVFATGEIYRSEDWTTDPVVSPALLPIGSAEGSQACIGAPIRVGEDRTGVIAAWRRRRSLFTDDDVDLIATLADLAALGVQRAVDDERLRDLSTQLLAANAELSQRYEEARQALEIHQRLVTVVTDGADLESIVEVLHSITDQEVRFVGTEGTVVGAGGWLAGLMAADRTSTEALGAEAVLLGPDDAGRHAIATAVRSVGLTWGELAVATRLPAATRDVVAAEQAAVACALLLSRQDAVAGAGRRLESEFVWDLLDGRIVDRTDAMVRSRQLGRELPPTARVILLSAAATSRGRRASTPEHVDHVRTELVRRAVGLLASGRTRPPMGWRGETLAVLVPDGPAARLRRLGSQLCGLGADLDRELSLGVSAAVRSIAGYPVAGRQARYAMAATRPPDAPVAVFEDLGAVQFLLEPASGEDLDRFVEQQLGVLIAYDREHDADLVETLAAYLRCDGHVQRAAEAMCVHPKTMSYRLGRIETLSGIAVARQADRFNAQLALKILAIREGRMDPG